MDERTAILPYGKQRLLEIAVAVASRPRVLLLDEPAAGVPEDERHVILDIVAALPADVTVLLIEHDMDLVFQFAERISVLVNGALFVEGTPDEIARDPRVRRSISARPPMADLLQVERPVGRLRRGRRAVRHQLHAGRRAVAGAARPQRHRQDHADQHARRPDHAPRRAASGSTAATSRASAPSGAARRHRLVAAGAQHLPLAHRGGEPDRHRAARRLDAWSACSACSRGWRSGAATSAASSRAASSRCWRSAAR